ncbi:MAG: hypothetical protein HP061_06155 [Christensenellaceae bacterium]|nr:hypothetical protein [Christensenellaceae bacterium]MCI5914726.1 transposon-encoded TnpW family protein [Christensenella sp.]
MNNDTIKATRTNNKQDGSFSMQMDNTTYVIGVHFSKTSRETLEDKVKRLIQRDVKDGNF